ncbi:MAG TPA: ComF family protein [Nitrospiraceae bacterium]|nr:ComF family protein [Nitrospiraceae bacterium]
MSSIAGFARRLLHAVLPVECGGCSAPLTDDPVPFFCRSCWSGLQPLPGPTCPRCGRPFSSSETLVYSPDHLCGPCRMRPPAYTQAWSAYPYVEPLHDAIRLFKYHKKVVLADALGQLLRDAPLDLPTVDVIMPVPLYPTRLREREYNQSLLLVDRLNRRLRLPVSYDNLVRRRHTPPQTELSRAVRLKNLRGAFGVLRAGEVRDQRVLLVDDVMTTGATVNECAKALRKAGAREVYVCTLARTI